MKVIIIGAGPIGCYVAQLLKKSGNGFDITLIEEHQEIGRPIHCAGLVSPDVFSELKVFIDDDMIINHIDGAEVFLNGQSFQINRQGVAVVIDRLRFDRALGTGLNINFNTRFVGIEREAQNYIVETDKGEYYADIVIGADGANSSLRKAVGFNEKIEYLRGVQFRMECPQIKKNLVRVYLKNPAFAWVIPEKENVVRAGIISDNPYRDLNAFLKESEIDGKILEKFAGVVPLGKCAANKHNIFLVGDAACQVKPLTHGGIYYGMRCAEILAECIAQDRPQDYEHLWRQKFEREINIGLKLKQIYEGLDNSDAERLFAVLKDNVHLIEKYGDFENHSKAISAIVKDSRLQILLGKVFIGMVKSMFV